MKLLGKMKHKSSGEELQDRYNRLRDKEESGLLDVTGRAELNELRGKRKDSTH